MNIFRKLPRKINEVGIKNCLVGAFLSLKYRRIQKIYKFDTWHFSPYEWREYLQKTAEYINANNAKKVIDIGCGLGELLRHLNAETRIGLDAHEEEIMAASALNHGNIIYKTGSFNEVVGEKNVDYLVTLGFTHGSPEETWRTPYHTIAEKNDIKNFIVDTVPAEGASHFLDFSKILPSNYTKIETLGPFLSGRYVEVWHKN